MSAKEPFPHVPYHRRIAWFSAQGFLATGLQSSAYAASVPAAEMSDEFALKQSLQSARKVGFCPTVSVVLIPTKEDFMQANLLDSLWYSHEDLSKFKSVAREERRMLLSHPPAIPVVAAPDSASMAICSH